MKQCFKCGEEKDDSEFYQPPGCSKPGSMCKECKKRDSRDRTRAWRAKNPGRTNANIRAWQKRNPDKHRAQAMWTKYRIRFDELWEAQGGKCAACGKPMVKGGKKWDSVCVDHDKTCCSGMKSCGKCVRGLIHWGCNMTLGHAEDNPELLRKAAAYLKR